VAQVGAGQAERATVIHSQQVAVARTGLRRAYTPATLDKLAVITAARAAGFTLTEIGELLAAKPGDAGLRQRLAAKASQLDDRITQLTAMRDSLRHAVACQHDPLTSCPRFLKALRTATHPEWAPCSSLGSRPSSLGEPDSLAALSRLVSSSLRRARPGLLPRPTRRRCRAR
jgi:hypothetical protein